MQRDSVGNTIKVALLLCVICSVVVSSAAVGLRGLQQANRLREKQKNILIAAGIYDKSRPVSEQYAERIKPRVVDLTENWYTDAFEPQEVSEEDTVNDPDLSSRLAESEDIAGIKRREDVTVVYEVYEGETLKQLILPIRGYGLWSTLRGFLSLDTTALTQGPEAIEVQGITYYSHKETPGLGGEVDNEDWKAQWEAKHVYDEQWNVLLAVVKPSAQTAEMQEYQVDALSGATITSQGVTNMIEFWLGEDGFRPFLKRLQAEST